MVLLALAALFGTHLFGGVSAQTWCNKNYMANQSIVPPGGNFPIPTYSHSPLLALRCGPAIKPYLAEDVYSPAAILIDALVVNYEIAGAAPISLPSRGLSQAGSIDVTVSLDGKTLARGDVPLNTTAFELPFSLEGLAPQMTPYNLTCSATYSGTPDAKSQSFSATASLSYIPNPTNSSVTKMDLRTGALLAKPATGLGGDYAPVFPMGFYTTFDGYLSTNLSIVNELKEQGFTVIHPVPTFDNMTAFEEVLDRMQEVGMYLMYDMRFTYMNLTSVTEQVNSIKNRPNLLLWYTADEPDGTSDPLNATSNAYDLIYSLDGYHPVSLVLNCQDYEWQYYTAGTDIVMQDAYSISNNVTWSNEWQTVCTPDYGDCGCDNCVGECYGGNATTGVGEDCSSSFFDISDRVDTHLNRLVAQGWERTKALWTVPQGFGGSEYWLRAPTGQEFVIESLIGVNHGALGIVSWNDPTPADIKTSASSLALALPSLVPFLYSPTAVKANYLIGGVDVSTWSVNGETLVVGLNTNYKSASVKWSDVGLKSQGATKTLFESGQATAGSDEMMFGSVGAGAFVVASW